MKTKIIVCMLACVAVATILNACQKVEEVTRFGRFDEVVNTGDNEIAPVISANGKTLYFTSDRKGGLGDEDAWKTRRFAGLWTPPVNLGAPINTSGADGIDTFSQDEKTLYMTSDRQGGFGKSDLYVSHLVNRKWPLNKLAGKKWTDPENLGATINTPNNEANASLSADGKTLYFVSDRPGGEGDYDIWVSQLSPDGKWGAPKNLGEPINTSGWEGYVFIAADGMTLYFSSNGHGGYGGADIFRSFFQNGQWTEPENLGPKINTAGNDTYISMPASGDIAYISTTRQGGKGKNDIIAVPMPALFEPKKIAVVVGNVTSTETGQPLKAWAKIKYRPTRQDLAVTETRPNGAYRLSFTPQKELVLMVYTEGDGYIPWYEVLRLDLEKDSQVIVRNLTMAPGKKPILKAEEGGK